MLRTPENEKTGPLATGPAFEMSSSLAAGDNSNSSKSRRSSQRALDPKWRSQRNWNNSNPVARRAHYLVAQAIRKGQLVLSPCEVCGDPKVDAHHDDPADAMTIRCLCRKHHRRLHARLRKGRAHG